MPRLPSSVIETALREARKKFCERDLFLIERDANERSMTFKFGAYLQDALSDYGVDVDCEYNRVGNEGGITKRIPRRFFPEYVPANDDQAQTVYPDIIVHKRGQHENHVVIEAKKAAHGQGRDEIKLAVLASEHGHEYEDALLLTFSSKDPYVEWEQLSRERIRKILDQTPADV